VLHPLRLERIRQVGSRRELDPRWPARPSRAVHRIHMNAVVMPMTTIQRSSRISRPAVPPEKFPTTDRSHADRLQNVLSGYQCGTVYKPSISRRKRPRLSLFIFGGRPAPSTLVNGETMDSKRTSRSVGAAHPIWTTPANIARPWSDGFVDASKLCVSASRSSARRGIPSNRPSNRLWRSGGRSMTESGTS